MPSTSLATRVGLWSIGFAIFNVRSVYAQSQSFSWGFPTLGSGTSLVECSTLKVGVSLTQIGSNPVGVPPFYMLAYPPDGVPSIAPIGSDPSNLSWTVNYPSGTSLLLEIADANGNSGGVDNAIYKVTPGSTSSCHGNPSSPISVKTSSTSITTCNPLVLDISGGSPPYTVSIVPQNGLHVYNTTMGPNDNQFTWIDRAIPSDSTVLLATVHDSTGQYSTSTSFISVSGPDDTTCAGKSDTSGQQSTSPSGVVGGGGGVTQPSGGGSSNNNNPPVSSPGGPTPGVISTGMALSTIVQGGSTIVSSVPVTLSGGSTLSAGSPTGTGGAGSDPQTSGQTNATTQSKSASNTPVIIGSVIGALALIAILALAVIINNRRVRNRDRNWDDFVEKEERYPPPPAPIPFTPYADEPNGRHPSQNGGFAVQQHEPPAGFTNGQYYDAYNNLPAGHQPPAGPPSVSAYTSSSYGQVLPPGAGMVGRMSAAAPSSSVYPSSNTGATTMNQSSATAFSQSAGVPRSPTEWDQSVTSASASNSDRGQPQQSTKGRMVRNPSSSGGAAGGGSGSPGPVIQHEDGGPVRDHGDDDIAPTEVPPSYASIRRE